MVEIDVTKQTDVSTEKIVYGGDCIAHINGKTVFVPLALPDEKLRIRIIESKRDYDRAEIVEIIKASPFRTTPICPLYGICGGCNFMHCTADAQRNFKKQMLYDCLVRAEIQAEQIPEIEIISGKDLGYRSRFQFFVSGMAIDATNTANTTGAKSISTINSIGYVGLKKRNSNETVAIQNCPVAEDAINKWLGAAQHCTAQHCAQKNNTSHGITHTHDSTRHRTHIFGSVYAAGGNVTVATESHAESYVADAWAHSSFGKKSKFKKPREIFSGTIIDERNIATVNLCDKNISFDVRGFFQSNMFVLEKAIPEICNFDEAKNVVDIYSGCGTFSVFLAERHKNIMLVEHNRDAISFAEKNLCGIKHESYGLSGAKWAMAMKSEQRKIDAVVIDPPRSGMEKEVREFLCNSGIRQINAVSCNPATHARDIAALIKSGYKMEKLFLLDFYPQTSHIECFARMKK